MNAAGNKDHAPGQTADTPPIDLRTPLSEAVVRGLPLGAKVQIKGMIYTGRDRLHRHLFDGGAAPLDLQGAALFHCGPIVVAGADGVRRVVAAGPTTSSREEPYMADIIARHGIRMILGKGGMGAATREACRRHGCVYVQAVGGAAAWIARRVRCVGRVWFDNEFGATEAMWEFEVEGLEGIVAIDAAGHSLFETVWRRSEERLRALLAHRAAEGD